MLSLADLLALEERIKVDMKRLDAELNAIRVLKERVRGDAAQVQVSQNSLFVDPFEGTEKPPTFAESVRQAIKTFGKEEFLVVNVENVLKARHVRLPPKNVRPRIAMVLQELVKKRVVTVAHRGEGNSPHRYRLLDQAEGESEKGEGAGRPPRITRTRPVRTPMLAA